MLKLTREQKNALLEVFRRGVVPMFGFCGGVTVPYCEMILAIESDGYIHS